MFGRNADARAWEAWQQVAQFANAAVPRGNWDRATMLGRIHHVYQPSRRGTKVIVDFGQSAGRRDTWWPNSRPQAGSWVLVECHLWLPPGTHSGAPVLYIDKWFQSLPEKTIKRARRHESRLSKQAATQYVNQ